MNASRTNILPNNAKRRGRYGEVAQSNGIVGKSVFDFRKSCCKRAIRTNIIVLPLPIEHMGKELRKNTFVHRFHMPANCLGNMRAKTPIIHRAPRESDNRIVRRKALLKREKIECRKYFELRKVTRSPKDHKGEIILGRQEIIVIRIRKSHAAYCTILCRWKSSMHSFGNGIFPTNTSITKRYLRVRN